MSGENGTHTLLLTPPGTGAIGVVRVVGESAVGVVSRFFRPVGRGSQDAPPLDARGAWLPDGRLRFGQFVVGAEVVDDVLVSRVPGLNRPGVDISAHGGVRIIERILMALDEGGAPFRDWGAADATVWPVATRIEQEALEALWRARTPRAVRFLTWQRQVLAKHLVEVAGRSADDPTSASAAVQRLIAGFSVAKRLIEGVRIALLGPPNSGKSTLFNRLVGRPAAIVSPREGTTRDWVTASVEFDGVPITLFDTAGRYETADALEHEAMGSGWAVGQDADLCILILDGSQPCTSRERDFCTAARALTRCFVVVNKADLPAAWSPAEGGIPLDVSSGVNPIWASGETGEGVELIITGALTALGFAGWFESSPSFFTQRQAETGAGILSDLTRLGAKAEVAIKQELIGTGTRGPESDDRSMVGTGRPAAASG